MDLQDKGVIDSGCSRHMIGNMSYLTDYEKIDEGYVAFEGNPKGGKITRKGTIKTGNLDFENVYFVRELKFNLFSVLQMCDKNNSDLFNDTECIVLSLNIKLTDESHVLLKVPRNNNMYSVDLKNFVPKGGLTSLFAKATSNESELWHRRLGHINFKTMNKLVKGNLLTDESHLLLKVPRKNNMYSVDLKNIVPKGGLTCLFVKATSDEYTLWHRRLRHINFKTMNKLVKGNLVRGLPLKLFENNQTCVACQKGKQHRASSRTSQQNGVAERKNRTLIEAARTMLVDSKLPTTFWAEAVNTTCYVQNRVLVTKPHNKTPYELFLGRKPALGFMRLFRCPVIILNIIDYLGKFDGKADKGVFVGYSINRSRPNWLFDIDALTKSMNYKPVIAGNQSNGNAGTKTCDDAGKARIETVPGKDYILLPLWTDDPPFSQDLKSSDDDVSKPSSDDGKKVDEVPRKESECNDHEKKDNVNNTNNVNAADTYEVYAAGGKTSIELPLDPNMNELEDYSIFEDDEDVGAEADMNNLDITIQVIPILTTRIHKDHPLYQKFGFTEVKTASIPIETQKPLLIDEDVCAYARYQVNPKVSHLYAMKRIFKYFKSQPKLSLWYPKDSPFDLVAYTDSDYA
ncbi:putative ribonuclease H-like domain-containing protein [Tanacetum coccineum]